MVTSFDTTETDLNELVTGLRNVIRGDRAAATATDRAR